MALGSARFSGADSVYRETYTGVLAKIEADERGGAKPDVVARAVAQITVSSNPRPRYIVGPFYEKLAVVVKRLLPAALFERMMMMNYGVK